MLKILEDIQPLVDTNTTGIGYFTQQLTLHLNNSARVEISGYSFGQAKSPSVQSRYRPLLLKKLVNYARYFGAELPLELFFSTKSMDVLLGTSYFVPSTLRKIPKIATIHDLCFVDHPEWVQGRNGFVLRKNIPRVLRRSSGVIAISQFTADRIRDVYSYTKPILVIDIPPKETVLKTLKPKQLDVNPGQYFLFISTIEPRKNIKTLLDAYEALPKNTQNKYPLILAGKPGWDPEVLERLQSGVNKNIRYLGYIDEAERSWLYANCTATVVPSHYEGFGMMTLESLSVGAPVITSDIAPQKEILGSSGTYFFPNDSEKLTKILLDYTSKTFRDRVLRKQLAVLENYSWEKTAQNVVKFLEKVVKK